METYRDILKSELILRKNAMSSYSLSKFAKDIGLTASRLSEILNRKDGLSHGSALEVARKLEFSRPRKKLFCTLVEAESGRSKLGRKIAKEQAERLKVEQECNLLREDAIELISQWYHLPIVELARLGKFPAKANALADKLSISIMEAEGALSRLKRLKLVSEQNGVLVTDPRPIRTSSDVPSSAIQAHHRSVLKKADQALTSQPVEMREFSSFFFPMSTQNLSKAKDKIRELRRAFVASSEDTKDGNDVFCLSMQLFPVTTKENSR